MKIPKEIAQNRKTEHDIEPLIVSRWSPRAMTGEALSDEELLSLFEAARWAPSAYNNQSWRFLYAKRDTAHWETFFNLLGDWNKQWCAKAAALVVVLSRTRSEAKELPDPTHSFDTGAAWENLALEATRRGLVAHAMSGFDYAKARSLLKVPEVFAVECMIALGKRGKKEELPQQMQEREVPSGRKPLKELVIEGLFHGA